MTRSGVNAHLSQRTLNLSRVFRALKSATRFINKRIGSDDNARLNCVPCAKTTNVNGGSLLSSLKTGEVAHVINTQSVAV